MDSNTGDSVDAVTNDMTDGNEKFHDDHLHIQYAIRNWVLPKYSFSKGAMRLAVTLALTLNGGHADAGISVSGTDYTNFGKDLSVPIFPRDGTLAFYQNKTDVQAATVLSKMPVIDIVDSDWKACIGSDPRVEWVQCTAKRTMGWVKRASFIGPRDAVPVANWAFRYWLYVTGSGIGGEADHMLKKAVPRYPYLIKPKQFENIFFLAHFDREGYALSPKTGKKTGDRVFLVGNAVYLAAADPSRRTRAPWLFLAFYHSTLNALCPGETEDSCLSAVNQQAGWPGIKALHATPAKSPAQPAPGAEIPAPRWYGPQLTAFARHADAVKPFLYAVPLDVPMQIDSNPISDAQLAINRVRPFCLLDCQGVANAIVLDPAPGAP